MWQIGSIRSIWQNREAGAVGFIIAMLVIGLLVANLVGTFAYQLSVARANASVAAIPGGSAMLGIIGLLFIIIPVVIFAKAAS